MKAKKANAGACSDMRSTRQTEEALGAVMHSGRVCSSRCRNDCD